MTGLPIAVVLFLAISSSASPLLNTAANDRLSKSKEILRYMNISVDPCEDFYEFSCGNYGKYHSAQAAKQPFSYMLREMQESAEEMIMGMLLTPDSADSEVDKKLKEIYRSCLMLPELMEKQSDIYERLTSEIGQMPALVGEQWREDEFDWLKTITGIKRIFFIDIIADCTILPEFTNKAVNGLYIGEVALPYKSKVIYVDEENKSIMEKYRMDVAKNLKTYLKMDSDLAIQTAHEIVDFEISLANGCSDDRYVIQLDKLYPPTTIMEAYQKYLPQWNATEQILMTFGSLPPFQLHINHDYMQNVLAVLAQTPKRIVANYVHYRFLAEFFIDFPKANSERDNQVICLEIMKKHYAKNFHNMMYRKYNLQDMEQRVDEMWQHIKTAFQKTLASERIEWLKGDTRKYAMDKLNAMDWELMSYKDYDFFNELGHFNVDTTNFLNNLKTIRKTNGMKSLELINQPPQNEDFSYGISSTPAYAEAVNKLVMPVFFLQPNYVFSSNYPNAYNFGTLGMVLAHELLHGFDDSGRGFDSHGNIHNWWDKASALQFDERVKCFTNQYKQYVFQGIPLPERSYQAENIADNGGLRLAYEAYLQWYQHAGDLASLESFPGLDFSHKQLYFLSFSHLWCSDRDPATLKLQIVSDSHTLEKFRVIGAISNFPEFSKEFKCPLGTTMNPETKCEIF